MPTPQNSSTGSLTTVVRHCKYFFPEADVTFRVENLTFRVHKRFFLDESPYFKMLLNSPAIPGTDPPGSSDTNPVVLEDTTSEAFACLLWVFYNPKYPIYTTTVYNWVQILTLAQMWGFTEVENLCVRELENLSLPPVERIRIYQQFKLDKVLLLEPFAQLTIRTEPISLEEGQSLDLETCLRIAKARELYRVSGSGPKPSVTGLQNSSFIRHFFNLDSFAL